MVILVNSASLGSPKDLLINDDGTFSWGGSEGDYYLFGFGSSKKSVEPIAQMHSIEVPQIYTKEEKKTFDLCNFSGPILWSSVLDREVYTSRAVAVCAALSKVLSRVKEHKYSNVFFEGNKILYSLSHATMDREKLKKYLSGSENLAAENFLKNLNSDICDPPVYDRVKTKTGRLTISSGTQVLTLPKYVRKCYRSSFKSGSLFEIDFTSLEPRCALNIKNKGTSVGDVYEHVKEASGLQSSRDHIKEFVISLLYGAGERRLMRILEKTVPKSELRSTLKSLKDFFGYDKLASRLVSQSKQGYIENYFGRKIAIDDAHPGLLINNFLQSTAVDVALLGFSHLTNKLSELGVKFLFVIHDALIIDVPPEAISKLQDTVGENYTHEELGVFPWKIKELK